MAEPEPDDAEHVATLLSSPAMFKHVCKDPAASSFEAGCLRDSRDSSKIAERKRDNYRNEPDAPRRPDKSSDIS